MARFQRRSFQRTSQRRKTTWIGGSVTDTTGQSLSQASSVIQASFDTRLSASQPRTPFTIIRLRGQAVFYSDQSAADEDPFGAIGAMLVNGESFDAGITAVPTPYTESSDNRWFWHEYWSAPVAATPASGIMTQFYDLITIDNKAMRKVEAGDVLIFVIENKSGAHACAFSFNVRVLTKLH